MKLNVFNHQKVRVNEEEANDFHALHVRFKAIQDDLRKLLEFTSSWDRRYSKGEISYDRKDERNNTSSVKLGNSSSVSVHVRHNGSLIYYSHSEDSSGKKEEEGTSSAFRVLIKELNICFSEINAAVEKHLDDKFVSPQTKINSLNSDLSNYKEDLKEKKRTISSLGAQLNASKSSVDELTKRLDRKDIWNSILIGTNLGAGVICVALYFGIIG